MRRVQILLELQAADNEWDEKARRYQAVRAQLQDTSEHDRLVAQRDKLQQALADTRARLHNSELELATLQVKYKEVNKRLYSGNVMNPRDLDNLQKESHSLKTRLENLENDTLSLMAEFEELEQQAASASASLKQFEEKRAIEQVSLTEEYNSLHSRLRELRELREKLRGLANRNDLALYDELRTKKNGNALAPMASGSCQACHVSVPSRKATLVETGEEIVLCEGCGRILYQA